MISKRSCNLFYYFLDKSNTYVVKRHKITDHSIIRPGYLYEFHAKSFGLGGLSSPAIISAVIIRKLELVLG